MTLMTKRKTYVKYNHQEVIYTLVYMDLLYKYALATPLLKIKRVTSITANGHVLLKIAKEATFV